MCILFVEDEPVISMVGEDALHDAGHEVMTAGDVAAAIDLIAAHPDRLICLVTDLHMPGELTGADLVEHIRERYPAIPVILATGRPDGVTLDWRKRHRVELLEKPYMPRHLVGVVNRLLHALRAPRPPFWNAALIGLEGEVARERLIPRWQNPYVFGSGEHDAWSDGWDKRDDELSDSPT